jgi:hypothetical protein
MACWVSSPCGGSGASSIFQPSAQLQLASAQPSSATSGCLQLPPQQVIKWPRLWYVPLGISSPVFKQNNFREAVFSAPSSAGAPFELAFIILLLLLFIILLLLLLLLISLLLLTFSGMVQRRCGQSIREACRQRWKAVQGLKPTCHRRLGKRCEHLMDPFLLRIINKKPPFWEELRVLAHHHELR